MKKYRNYTDNDVIEAAKIAKSITQVLKILDLKQAGGNYINMKRTLQRLNVDTSHWTGQGWNKGQQLKDWSQYTRANNLKKHLIKERGHCCESCKLITWMDQQIPLELEHIDGDRTNNNISNLRLLCCNCHSFTPTWRRKKQVPRNGLEPLNP